MSDDLKRIADALEERNRQHEQDRLRGATPGYGAKKKSVLDKIDHGLRVFIGSMCQFG